MTPSVRMLELLSILQDGREHTGASSAERLDASSRTVRRDLDRLRELGYPVESRRGPGGAYRLVAGSALPPLLFTDDEAVAAVVGLRLVGEAGEGALRKLERVLPSRLAHRVRRCRRRWSRSRARWCRHIGRPPEHASHERRSRGSDGQLRALRGSGVRRGFTS